MYLGILYKKNIQIIRDFKYNRYLEFKIEKIREEFYCGVKRLKI